MHHDVWDYDVGSQPILADLPGAQGPIPALIQLTKRGEVFVLNRRTGHPITRVEERPAPQTGAAEGERLSPTQPFSAGMPSLKGPDLRETDMWGISPVDQLYCRIKFKETRYEGPMTPPGLTPALFYPGYMGGANWGSGAIDLERGLLVVVTNRIATYTYLISRTEADKMGLEPTVFESEDKGVGPWAQGNTPFAANAIPFMSPLGMPCQKPPYGVITAIDLGTRSIAWQRPLGTARENGPLGLASNLPLPLGPPAQGGGILTASGLVFVGASLDRYFRAMDASTGKELWRSDLPAAGLATPMTYLSPKSGRQFIVIAAGGHPKLGIAGGDEIIAYALPQVTGR